MCTDMEVIKMDYSVYKMLEIAGLSLGHLLSACSSLL